ncbi:MAG: hypothetical protein GX496_06870 [Firmicutes bacterium]|nr:hypothetical protein [Bacillota bacterium]
MGEGAAPAGESGSLAPLVPGTRVMGRLEAGDEILEDDDTFFDAYVLEGELGRTVTVVLRAEFDAYLLLVGPQGDVVAEDDASGGGRDARIIYTFPSSGQYLLVVNSYSAGETGRYLLQAQVTGLGPGGVVVEDALKSLPLSGSPYWLMRPGGWYEGESLDGTVIELYTERDDDPYPCLSVAVEELARYGVSDVGALFARMAIADEASRWEVVTAGWTTINGVAVHRSVTVAPTVMGRIQTLRLMVPWEGRALVASFQERAASFRARLPLFEALAGTLVDVRED